MNKRAAFVSLCTVLAACTASPGELNVEGYVSELTSSQRREVSEVIKSTVAARGIHNGLLFAGIANAETNMSHCWRDATWACKGPTSPDCGGGPVIAGSADGPCSAEQGGLGMFQFDAGTYEDTLAREGDRILSLAGNIEAAVDFVIAMVIRSQYIAGVDTDAQAIEWLNQVRPNNDEWDIWIQTVVHYYNGCRPGRCSVYDSRVASYTENHLSLYNEFGHEFWYGDDSTQGPIETGGIPFAASDSVGLEEFQYYELDVVAGVRLRFELSTVGDADLYLAMERDPTVDDYDARSFALGDELYIFEPDFDGVLHIGVYGFASAQYRLDVFDADCSGPDCKATLTGDDNNPITDPGFPVDGPGNGFDGSGNGQGCAVAFGERSVPSMGIFVVLFGLLALRRRRYYP